MSTAATEATVGAGAVAPGRKPEWLRVRLPTAPTFYATDALLRGHRLNTVCESAACPNRWECWSEGTATFMLLGDVCTRACGFCNVKSGVPAWNDPAEPERVAAAAARMGLAHVVITSVNRDDLPDGGAALWAETVRRVREARPACTVEALVPDFRGRARDLDTVLAARPDILAHNVETVPRLYLSVRPGSRWERSLALLRRAADAGFVTKSGMMLGLGEDDADLSPALAEARAAGVAILTLGQYLQPTRAHLPVRRFVSPEEFAHWREVALGLGFRHAECGPLVRSSYHAGRYAPARETS